MPALFQIEAFRTKLLGDFVDDPEILTWWVHYFDALYASLQVDVVNPIMTKIHRFSTHRLLRNIVGQSSSTVDWHALLNARKILLVNTATGVIGPDAAGLLGAVLLDHINLTVREQSAIPDATRRVRGMVVIDEFQSIPGVDYPGLLAELQKMGASFVLATQTLRQLDALDPILGPTVLANVDSLFVFQVSAEDARLLARELDEAVDAVDIINQPSYACYVKTQLGRGRLLVMHVETLPPQPGDERTAEKILAGVARYTRPIEAVEAERRAFVAQWQASPQIRIMKTNEETPKLSDSAPLFEDTAIAEREAVNQANDHKKKTRSKHYKQGPSNAGTPA